MISEVISVRKSNRNAPVLIVDVPHGRRLVRSSFPIVLRDFLAGASGRDVFSKLMDILALEAMLDIN
ncbi:hypothetical protein CDL15_Pgr012007 [Punica granatum]|uniref:Uncharacterized protein n=1 Tax=Punica granatum TaxID=22663 RepID=A0A218VUA8_PUNGR|nr:hypothetical protein CDL15_Pgr012007 [Punica granatum]